jgi:hypothetical protein
MKIYRQLGIRATVGSSVADLFDFISLGNDGNIPSKSNMQKHFFTNF